MLPTACVAPQEADLPARQLVLKERVGAIGGPK